MTKTITLSLKSFSLVILQSARLTCVVDKSEDSFQDLSFQPSVLSSLPNQYLLRQEALFVFKFGTLVSICFIYQLTIICISAGQERFKAITSAHYRKSLGALLVYDITKEQTFKNIEKWISEVKEHAEPDIVLMLVGNKLDICQRDPGER